MEPCDLLVEIDMPVSCNVEHHCKERSTLDSGNIASFDRKSIKPEDSMDSIKRLTTTKPHTYMENVW